MIRINLLPQKRTRRRDPGTQQFLVIVFLVLVEIGALTTLLYLPLGEEVERLEATTADLARENKDKEKRLKGYKELKDAVAAAEERKKVIMRLNDARATPAHLMFELSSILTPKRTPTMTDAMIREFKENPNRELSPDWDAKHVWITSLTEKGGEFVLEGGAQSDSDMTQLALRLQASAYFHDVVPKEGKEFIDKDSGVSYYKFTIVGKVAY